MPTILKKSMKDIFCTSSSSIAICSSTTDPYTPRHRLRDDNHNNHRPIHHHRVNSYLQNQYKNLPSAAANCLSDQHPITPRAILRKTSSSNRNKNHPDIPRTVTTGRRKSSADVSDFLRRNTRREFLIRRSPSGGSSRYLLLGDVDDDDDKASSMFQEDNHDDENHKLAIIPSEPVQNSVVRHEVVQAKKRGDDDEDDRRSSSSLALVLSQPAVRVVKDNKSVKDSDSDSIIDRIQRPSSSSSLNTTSNNHHHHHHRALEKKYSSPALTGQNQQYQVSLHCKGCASKLKKHLNKMEGVTSFVIEFESKKVTVIGKVTPHEVLASVSKVKKAELWSPESSLSSSLTTSSTSSFSSSSSSELDFIKSEYFS